MKNYEKRSAALAEVLMGQGRRTGIARTFGTPDNTVIASLRTDGEAWKYSLLRLDWVRSNTPEVTFLVDLQDSAFKTEPNNPATKEGGYWWGVDEVWYNWKPKAELVWERVKEILEACGITNSPHLPRTYGVSVDDGERKCRVGLGSKRDYELFCGALATAGGDNMYVRVEPAIGEFYEKWEWVSPGALEDWLTD